MAMLIERVIWIGLAASLAGCVAPEAPPAPRVSSSVTATPTISTAGYEDAPVANRKLGPTSPDSVIRVAR